MAPPFNVRLRVLYRGRVSLSCTVGVLNGLAVSPSVLPKEKGTQCVNRSRTDMLLSSAYSDAHDLGGTSHRFDVLPGIPN